MEKAGPLVSDEELKVGGLVGLYWRAVGLVSKYTGVHMESGNTIREYLKQIRVKVGPVYGFFERISLIFEKFLYGPRILAEEEKWARKCAAELEGGLSREG